MKQPLATILTAFAITLIVAVSPARGQFGFEVVKDPWNLAQNVEQIRRQWDQIRRMEQNLKKIPDRLYRDLYGQLDALLAASERGTVSWTTPGVADLFAEYYGALALTPEVREIIDAQGLQKERSKAALSTLAASVGSVATHAADYESTLSHLEDLKANAGAAQGNLAALEVGAMYQDAIAHELVKLNQGLGALLSGQNAALGYDLSQRASFEATVNLGIDLFLDREIPVYDGADGQTGIPFDWPYSCLGCN